MKITRSDEARSEPGFAVRGASLASLANVRYVTDALRRRLFVLLEQRVPGLTAEFRKVAKTVRIGGYHSQPGARRQGGETLFGFQNGHRAGEPRNVERSRSTSA